jgi:MinD-like ATPase involved in chromosome partitioning or flagellar assembly
MARCLHGRFRSKEMMMVRFDDVISVLVRTCEQDSCFGDLEKVCVVRDLQGKVRLVVEPKNGANVDVGAFGKTVKGALGNYFDGPILSTTGGMEVARLAYEILAKSEPWPDAWPLSYEDPISGKKRPIAEGPWTALQRYLAKEAWLSPKKVKAPWPLQDQTPAIVSFYSFKGGVGRTLLVGAMAWHMAEAGKRVAVLDLDLEAPGVSVLLGAEGRVGIVDFIVDFLATEANDLAGCYAPARAFGDKISLRVDVFGAGKMGWSYLEKIARLDFASSTSFDDQSPTLHALKELLKRIKSVIKPDFILLDSRSGLHDIGGLSLHALSHVDVLVARAGPQNIAGLELTLQTLKRRRPESEFRSIVVHSFAPPSDTHVGTDERQTFREQCHQIFTDHVYVDSQDDDPAMDDEQAMHFPWVIPAVEHLERVTQLGPWERATIASYSEFGALYERIMELCAPEETDEEDDGSDRQEVGG